MPGEVVILCSERRLPIVFYRTASCPFVLSFFLDYFEMRIELDPELEISLHDNFCCFCWLTESLAAYHHMPSCLDDYERNRILAFRNNIDKWRFTAARLIVRTVLAIDQDCDKGEVLLRVQQGRPFSEANKASLGFFSIAHSAMGILVGFSRDGQIGVDIEQEQLFPNRLGVARRVMTDDEYGAFRKLDGDEATHAFYQLWVRKEAVLKYLGTGFSLDPASIRSGIGSDRIMQIERQGGVIGLDDGTRINDDNIYHWATAHSKPSRRVSIPKFHVKLTVT